MPGTATEVVPRSSGGREFCSCIDYYHEGRTPYVAHGVTPVGVSNFTGVLEDFDLFVDPVRTGQMLHVYYVTVSINVINSTDSSLFSRLYSYRFAVSDGGDSKTQRIKARYPISFSVPEGYTVVVEFVGNSQLPAFSAGANLRWRSSNIVYNV